jgi:branched-chain amino acid transport system substrate-binding protein
MRHYAPGVPLDGSGIEGWTSAQLFAAATQNLPDNPTTQDVLAGLWSIKNNDLGGLTGPITFTKGQNAPEVLCWWAVQLKSGQAVSPNGGQRSCK